MIKRLLLFVLFVFLIRPCFPAIIVIDSTLMAKDEVDVNPAYEDNLDSLLNLYYIQNSPAVVDMLVDSATMMNDSAFVYIPDSVYIHRLSMIPAVFKITYNQVVRRYIEVYTQKKRDKVQVMLGVADYYMPIFDDIFDYYGIPNEMKYTSVIESALNPRARSRARAIGLWQFIYGTGKTYGLTINSLVDERCDPIKATHAACRYLKDLHDIFGDWSLALAAYNCGPGNVKKAIRRSGGKHNFWDIYRYLPRETRGYVPAFIAAIYTMNYYKEHNLVPLYVKMPLQTDTLMIQQYLHLGQVSELLHIPLQQLRDLNPQYIRDVIPARGTAYSLRLPSEYISKFIDQEPYIYTYKDSVFFNPKEMLKAPNYFGHAGKPDGYTGITYKVGTGESLGTIAKKFHIKVNDLKDWNDIYRNRIRVGQKLVVYLPKKKAKAYLKETAENKDQAVAEPEKTSQSASMGIDGDYMVYEVKQGDTMWDIAKMHPGMSTADIKRWNNLSDAESIKPGQKLLLKVVQ